MRQSSARTGRLEQVAIAILAAYALVVQMLFAGYAVGATASPYEAAFALCESGHATPDQPGPMSGHDAELCCLAHCVGGGAVPPAVAAPLAPPVRHAIARIGAGADLDVTPEAALPPLGSRAPPMPV